MFSTKIMWFLQQKSFQKHTSHTHNVVILCQKFVISQDVNHFSTLKNAILKNDQVYHKLLTP